MMMTIQIPFLHGRQQTGRSLLFQSLAIVTALAVPCDADLKAADGSTAIYPLRVGNRWTYTTGDVDVVEEVTARETVGNDDCARVETKINGRLVAHELITVRPDGIYRISVGDDMIEPPLCFFKYPVQSRVSWAVASKVNGLDISGEFTSGDATVSVPSGKYRAVTSRGEHFRFQGSELDFTYSFAPGVGKVQQIISANGKTLELQLKEFRPAP